MKLQHRSPAGSLIRSVAAMVEPLSGAAVISWGLDGAT
jgi:hypothetical protein